MALDAQFLVQQKASLEGKIKLLINADLKEICRHYGFPISGTKAILQGRCMEILNNFVRAGDITSVEELKYRLNNHGTAPLPGYVSAAVRQTYIPPPPPSSYSMGSAMSHAAPPPSRSTRYFKPSPFYEVLDTVIPLSDLIEMPQNRNTDKKIIMLKDDIVRRVKGDPQCRLLLYAGQTVSMVAGSTDISFPNQLEVRINNDEVRHNFKGLKGRSGTTKPADITGLLRLQPGYQNVMLVTYALTTRKFSYTVLLARRISTDTLVEQIKNSKVITKQSVLDEMSQKSAEADITATTINMSLRDPVSTMRITLPVRSTICTHNQCFDGSMFLQLQEQAPQWQCPICNKPISFSQLCIDKYFEDILHRTSSSIDKVSVNPDGEWMVIKQEENENEKSALKPRATYDDDFDDDDDDDILEISDDHTTTMPTQARTQPWTPASNGFMASTHTARQTPVASASRQPSFSQSIDSRAQPPPPPPPPPPPSNKRPASAVIDLTLSDDEDEPPRPMKRATAQPYNHHSISPTLKRSTSQMDSLTHHRQIPSRPPSFTGSTHSTSFSNMTPYQDPSRSSLNLLNTSYNAHLPNPSPSRPPPPAYSSGHPSLANGHALPDPRSSEPRLILPTMPTRTASEESRAAWSNYPGYSTSPEQH